MDETAHLVCPACGRKKYEKGDADPDERLSSFLDGMEKRVNPHKFK